MTEEGRSGATDRRTMKDTCIGCKSAKIKVRSLPLDGIFVVVELTVE